MKSSKNSAATALLHLKRFMRNNSAYVMLLEMARRTGVVFRRSMLGTRLGCPDIVLGARCHLRGIAHIRIGKDFQAAEGLWLEAVTSHAGQLFSPEIRIGENVRVSRWSHIAAIQRVEIGDGVLIGSRVIVTDHNHGHYDGPHSSPEIPPNSRPLAGNGQVTIGRNVWLCDGVVVTPGASIGEGSIVGANSVVIGAIPPWTVAAGAPARPVKRYDFNKHEWVRV
jgi:lipopolysaccharide O-acetyltransferase